MAQTELSDKNLAEAIAKIVDALHHCYRDIKIKSIPSYEDEDFTLEVRIPENLSEDEVLNRCHMECIRAEDEFDVFILPKVVYSQQKGIKHLNHKSRFDPASCRVGGFMMQGPGLLWAWAGDRF